ncbi:MAG TPA: hypothetical protein DCM05_04305 [Elusimicrobia bacterium]|nr:hypothetical protein [Elusimicrobiota bacterium]
MPIDKVVSHRHFCSSTCEDLLALRLHDHICLIYETPEEQFDAILPYIRKGLESREKCVYVADDNTAAKVERRMRQAWPDFDAWVAKKALVIVGKADSYLRSGRFDPDEMCAFLKEAIRQAKSEGFTALRTAGEMTWALGKTPGIERLMEYEAMLNGLAQDHDCILACQFNKGRFPPELLRDALRTHPFHIWHGMLLRNFYYADSSKFMAREYRENETSWVLDNLAEHELLIRAHSEIEGRYRTLCEAVPMAVFVLSERLRIIDCNRRCQELLGYRREDLIGEPFGILVEEESRGALMSRLRGLDVARSRDAADAVLLHKDSHPVRARVHGAKIDVRGASHGDLLLCVELSA